jgi:hypothetical protein
MKPLYSPPNGTFPQEVPSYYRGADKVIRTDLPELSHEELIAFGFTGPYEMPVGTHTDEEGNVIEGDFDPETEYWEWSETHRNFIIKNKTDEAETILNKETTPPEPQPTPEWGAFKEKFLSYEPLNTIIANSIAVIPIAALSFPTTFLECEKGNYADFQACWNLIKTKMKVTKTTINYIKKQAISHHLPQDFINLI